MTPKPNEIWLVSAIFEWEKPQKQIVRIMEVLPSGNIDVNYELNPIKPRDLRILPKECLIGRVEEKKD